MPKQDFSIFAEGANVFIRTVTHYLVGKVVCLKDVGQTTFVVLEQASWVADMHRFYNTLKDGFPKEAEIEPVTGICAVSVGSIVDVFEWKHDLPTEQQ